MIQTVTSGGMKAYQDEGNNQVRKCTSCYNSRLFHQSLSHYIIIYGTESRTLRANISWHSLNSMDVQNYFNAKGDINTTPINHIIHIRPSRLT